MPLDNNGAERAIRGVVLGRKNHYGSRSQCGTEVAGVFYSLIESAKLVGVEPAEYLRRAAEAALRGGEPIIPFDLATARAWHRPPRHSRRSSKVLRSRPVLVMTAENAEGAVTMSMRIDSVARLLSGYFRRNVDMSDFQKFLQDTLEGDRDLMGAHAAGLVTTNEVVDALIDRGAVHVLGAPMDVAAEDAADLDRLRERLRTQLFGNGP